MTIDELLAREAIRKTICRYTRAVDNRRYDELREVFLPEGSIAVQGGARLDGVEAIIEAFGQGAIKRRAAEPGNFQRHNLTTSMIDVIGPDEATGAHYVIVVTELGFDHTGLYTDTYRRRGDEWLVHERNARMEWVRPGSRFASWLGAASPAPTF